MIKDKWLLGVGLGNFAPQYINYQAAYFNNLDNSIPSALLAGDNRYAFNDLLQITAERGIIDTILFAAIILVVIVRIFSLVSSTSDSTLLVAGGGLSIIISILIAGLSAYPLEMVPIAIMFWCGTALAGSGFQYRVIPIKISFVLRLTLTLFLLTIAVFFLGYGYQRTVAYYNWKQSKNMPKSARYENILPYYKYLCENGEYLSEIGQSLMEGKDYQTAIHYLREAITRSPSPSIYYLLAECYVTLNNYEAAIKTVNTVRQAIPNLLRPRYLLAKFAYQQGDISKFINLAKQAINFDPKIDNSEVKLMKDDLRQMLSELGQ